jgi:hypothetical protein
MSEQQPVQVQNLASVQRCQSCWNATNLPTNPLNRLFVAHVSMFSAFISRFGGVHRSQVVRCVRDESAAEPLRCISCNDLRVKSTQAGRNLYGWAPPELGTPSNDARFQLQPLVDPQPSHT